MTDDEFTQYWLPARIALASRGEDDDVHGFDHSMKLGKKLGINYLNAGDWKLIHLTPELKIILLGITGPHRETMLKIYQIKRKRKV